VLQKAASAVGSAQDTVSSAMGQGKPSNPTVNVSDPWKDKIQANFAGGDEQQINNPIDELSKGQGSGVMGWLGWRGFPARAADFALQVS